MFVLWMPFRPYAALFNAELIKTVINHPDAMDKAKIYSLSTCLFGEGLITRYFTTKLLSAWMSPDVVCNGEKWHRRRKQITPAFHLGILRNYIAIFNEQSRTMIKKLAEETQKPWTEIDKLLLQCTLDIFCDSAMSYKVNAQKGNKYAESYFEAYHHGAEAVIYRVIRPWTYNDTVFFNCFSIGRKLLKILGPMREFNKKIIEAKKHTLMKERKANSNNNGIYNEGFSKHRKMFLDLMIETHLKDPAFSLADVQEEVDTFMVAGHDTTAITLRWTLYLLGLHPDIQEKVMLEQNAIFLNDSHREVTFEDLNKMQYAECVIKETLRLFPPVPLVGREVEKDMEIGDFVLPKGTLLFLVIPMLHRDPVVFPDPENFDPDRFLPQNCVNRHPYAFIPFSAGPRNCIGQKFAMMSVKVQLSHILRNYKVTSLDPRDQIHLKWEILLGNTKPVRLRLAPR